MFFCDRLHERYGWPGCRQSHIWRMHDDLSTSADTRHLERPQNSYRKNFGRKIIRSSFFSFPRKTYNGSHAMPTKIKLEKDFSQISQKYYSHSSKTFLEPNHRKSSKISCSKWEANSIFCKAFYSGFVIAPPFQHNLHAFAYIFSLSVKSKLKIKALGFSEIFLYNFNELYGSIDQN